MFIIPQKYKNRNPFVSELRFLFGGEGEIFAQALLACTLATKDFAFPRPMELGRQNPSCCDSILNALSATGSAFKISLSHRCTVRGSNLAPPTQKGCHRHPLLWRRRRDSNSRTAFDGYTISNRARSTSYATSPYLFGL